MGKEVTVRSKAEISKMARGIKERMDAFAKKIKT